MELKVFTEKYAFGDVTYYKTSDDQMFEDRLIAEAHQKFIDEVPQYHIKTITKLTDISSFYRIDGKPQLDMFIKEMEQLHENFEPVYYNIDVKEEVDLVFPLYLALSYHYDDEYSYYTVDSLENDFIEWQENLYNEQRARLEATEALCALQE